MMNPASISFLAVVGVRAARCSSSFFSQRSHKGCEDMFCVLKEPIGRTGTSYCCLIPICTSHSQPHLWGTAINIITVQYDSTSMIHVTPASRSSGNTSSAEIGDGSFATTIQTIERKNQEIGKIREIKGDKWRSDGVFVLRNTGSNESD